MVAAYARVSTDSQNLDRQLDALKRYGIDKLYCEKISGTKKSRPDWTGCSVNYMKGIRL